MKYAIAIAALVLITGCAGQHNLKDENAELKAQVSALQTQVADLRAENAKLATAAATPLTIDGLKLEPPKFGELRFTTPTSGPRPLTYTGPTHYITVAGDNSYAGTVTLSGQTVVGTIERPAAGTFRARDLQVGGSGTLQKTTAPTTKTTTTSTTSPQK